MLIKEFRVVLPLTVEEYQVGQLYSVAKASKNETGGGEGIEVLKNEPFHGIALEKGGQTISGQYTHKIYHLGSKVPAFIRYVAPTNALEIHEEAWNAYPYCRTILTNPGYMKEGFRIVVETLHAAGAATIENAHCLPEDKLKLREVVDIDIAHDTVDPRDYNPHEDPKLFHSMKTSRGPLAQQDWTETVDPVMTCYKLVTCEFKWYGLQTKVEDVIVNSQRRIFTNFHRQVFCWLDEWHGLTIEDIRRLEDETKEELDKQIKTEEKRGTRE